MYKSFLIKYAEIAIKGKNRMVASKNSGFNPILFSV